MRRLEFSFLSADKKTKIRGIEWCPDTTPTAVLHIVHGLTEHMMRYEKIAEYFTARNIAVVGSEHLGHGVSVKQDGAVPMYCGSEGSWNFLVKDMATSRSYIRKKYENVPYFILGFSLGSFVVRDYLAKYQKKCDGVILIGTGYTSPAILRMIRLVAKLEGKRAGEENPTPLISKLTFETYNKSFAPNKTKYDWLCSDEESLAEYIRDEDCGDDMSAGFFRELLSGMIHTGTYKNIQKIKKEIPVLLISGGDDPVGNQGTGVDKVQKLFCKAGINKVDKKLYPGLRHDILREKCSEEILDFIYKWLIKQE